jgi:LytS/YehU family sensor histidine kinase
MESPLEKEIQHIELYLDIEKVRFGERLSFHKEIQEESLIRKIPIMILQPLLENAVKHGVYESTDTTKIQFKASLMDDLLEIRIGNKYDPEAIQKQGTGTGLKNIRGRLLNLYGTGSLMKINKSEDYFEVILRIPENVQ